jgi:hypothetical protein
MNFLVSAGIHTLLCVFLGFVLGGAFKAWRRDRRSRRYIERREAERLRYFRQAE